MDVLFLCGVFAKENEAEVIAQARILSKPNAVKADQRLERGH